jgi:hypothetical protein
MESESSLKRLQMPANCPHSQPDQSTHIVYLTLKNCASYIQERRTATLQMLHFIYFFQQI